MVERVKRSDLYLCQMNTDRDLVEDSTRMEHLIDRPYDNCMNQHNAMCALGMVRTVATLVDKQHWNPEDNKSFKIISIPRYILYINHTIGTKQTNANYHGCRQIVIMHRWTIGILNVLFIVWLLSAEYTRSTS